MITYESLKELAHALSKVTGYRYVAFYGSLKNKFITNVSDSEMLWYPSEQRPPGIWINESDCQILDLRDIPNLDWSKCQFDCKEADNEEED